MTSARLHHGQTSARIEGKARAVPTEVPRIGRERAHAIQGLETISVPADPGADSRGVEHAVVRWSVMMTGETANSAHDRIERDTLGELPVPAHALWGIHTARAIHNFPISGRRVHPALIRGLALVKKAAALTHGELGDFEMPIAQSIATACDEVLEGRWADQFPVDALQGGAGTSLNMNMNEVLANRALELLGRQRGEYWVVDPIEHVNLHQSTNDVVPTAARLAAIAMVRSLSCEYAALQSAAQDRERAFSGIVAIGRTEWQEAVPVVLGAEFGAYADAFARDRWRAYKSEERLRVINLGGTAVGTGIGAPRDYVFRVVERLRELTGYGLTRAENGLDATSNLDSWVETAGMLAAAAANLSKMARDLRIRHFTGELRLPPRQVGSSLMPGKVNPVIPEAIISAATRVMALTGLVADYAAQGSERINEFLPALADAWLEAADLVGAAARLLAGHLREIEADADECRRRLDRSPALVTALVPVLGYRRVEELAMEIRREGVTEIRAALVKQLGESVVDNALAPSRLLAPAAR